MSASWESPHTPDTQTPPPEAKFTACVNLLSDMLRGIGPTQQHLEADSFTKDLSLKLRNFIPSPDEGKTVGAAALLLALAKLEAAVAEDASKVALSETEVLVVYKWLLDDAAKQRVSDLLTALLKAHGTVAFGASVARPKAASKRIAAAAAADDDDDDDDGLFS